MEQQDMVQIPDKKHFLKLLLTIISNFIAGHKEIVEILIREGAKVNCRDGNKECALHSASKLGYKPIVEVLVENGSEIDCVDLIGQTPLLAAGEYGKFKIKKKLVKKSILHIFSINQRFCAHLLPWLKVIKHQSSNEFELSSFAGQKEVAEFLIQNGADVNHEMNYGISALHLSAKHGNFRDFM